MFLDTRMILENTTLISYIFPKLMYLTMQNSTCKFFYFNKVFIYFFLKKSLAYVNLFKNCIK